MVVKNRHKKVADRFRRWQHNHQYFSIEHQERVFNRMADEEFRRENIKKAEARRVRENEGKSSRYDKV
jgi:hypothetical protein